jgi:hypothetical protein
MNITTINTTFEVTSGTTLTDATVVNGGTLIVDLLATEFG